MRVVLTALSAAWLACASSRADESKLSLKVIYAGMEGTERSRDFVDFLRGRVAEVGSTDFAAFRDRDAEGYDVVILDGDPGELDRSYDKDANPPVGWPELSPA